MRLLEAFIANPNEVLSREDLIETVWGVDFGGDERLSRAISLLRKSLGDIRKDGKYKYIETISRRGYRFLATVEAIEDEANSVIQSENHKDKISSNDAGPTKSFPQTKKRKSYLIAGAVAVIALFSTIGITAALRDSPVSITTPWSVNSTMNEGLDRIEHFGHANAIEDAKASFRDIISKNPNHAGSRAGLALALIREYTAVESDPAILKQARASAEQAISLDEHLGLSHIAMGWVEEFDKDLQKATTYLEQAEILDPENPLIAEGLMRVLFKQGKVDEAEELARDAIITHPSYSIFSLNLSQIYFYQNDIEAAIKTGKNAIELDPESSRLYGHLAHLYHMQGNTPDAIRTLQEGLKIHETASLYNNLGTYLFFQGQYETAFSAFEKTVELKGNSHNALHWANLGDSYRWVPGREEDMRSAFIRALQIWTETSKKAPNDKDLITRIALYTAKLGNTDKARTLVSSIAFTDSMPSSYYYRALVTHELLEDRETALRFLGMALDAGYPLTEIRNDPELKSLREDANYHKILAKKGI